LIEARREFPDVPAILVCETDPPPGAELPEGIVLVPVWRFLL
jgi:hypothetical protein